MGVGVGRADQTRDRVLVLQGQPVGAPARHAVQRDPRVEQQVAGLTKARAVGIAQVAERHEGRDAGGPPAAARRRARAARIRPERPADPTRRLHVAQAAGAVLQIGLEHLGDRPRPLHAGGGAGREVVDEPVAALRREPAHLVHEVVEQRLVPRDQASVEERGERVQLAVGEREGLLHRARRVAEHEPGVPQRVPELRRVVARARHRAGRRCATASRRRRNPGRARGARTSPSRRAPSRRAHAERHGGVDERVVEEVAEGAPERDSAQRRRLDELVARARRAAN